MLLSPWLNRSGWLSDTTRIFMQLTSCGGVDTRPWHWDGFLTRDTDTRYCEQGRSPSNSTPRGRSWYIRASTSSRLHDTASTNVTLTNTPALLPAPLRSLSLTDTSSRMTAEVGVTLPITGPKTTSGSNSGSTSTNCGGDSAAVGLVEFGSDVVTMGAGHTTHS